MADSVKLECTSLCHMLGSLSTFIMLGDFDNYSINNYYGDQVIRMADDHTY